MSFPEISALRILVKLKNKTYLSIGLLLYLNFILLYKTVFEIKIAVGKSSPRKFEL